MQSTYLKSLMKAFEPVVAIRKMHDLSADYTSEVGPGAIASSTSSSHSRPLNLRAA